MVYILIGYIDGYIYMVHGMHDRPTDRSIDRRDRPIDRSRPGRVARSSGRVLLTSHDSKRERHTPTRRGLDAPPSSSRVRGARDFIHSFVRSRRP